MDTATSAWRFEHGIRRGVARIRPVLTHRGLWCAVLVISTVFSIWSIARVPDASPLPILFGLVPFAIGKYVLCALRWHALSASGRGRWWHLRAYAESELLGQISPVRAGGDLWRVHRLHGVGMSRTAALAEIAIDRAVGIVGIALGIVLAGVALPAELIVAFALVALVTVVFAVLLRSYRPDLLVRRPLPSAKVFAFGVGLSLVYQAGIAGLIFAVVTAIEHSVDPVGLLAVFAASQLAAMVPGIGDVNARTATLAVGLTSLGISWTAALGAVSLIVLLPWVPAILLGGVSLAVRASAPRQRRVARTGPPVAPPALGPVAAPVIAWLR